MRKIGKANSKKFVTEIVNLLNAFGAKSYEAYKGSSERNYDWKLRTFGGTLKLSLEKDQSQSVCYTLFAQFEDVDAAKACDTLQLDDRLNRHSGKWNFHYGDLNAAISDIKLDISRVRQYQQSVRAEIHTDDHNVKKDFDAIEWFDQASDKVISDLAACEFRGDYPADAIGIFMADKNKDVEDVFTYLRLMAGKKDSPGFEVSVNEEDVMNWLLENRPELHDKIKELQD